MNLEINPDLGEVRDAMRRFTREQLEPISLEMDQTGVVPQKAWDLMRDAGYLGMQLPTEYGGGGYDMMTYCLALEEFSRSSRVWTMLLDYTSGLAPLGVVRFGTDEQKDKYLPKISSGQWKAAFGLTEPGAGSDSAAISTSARRGDGGWVINGKKHYISGGNAADVVLLMTVTDSKKRARGGITAFLVDKGTPGFSVTRTDTTIGSDAIKLGELTFEDCFVPDGALLGDLGDGFKIAMGSLTSGRLGVACACIGGADRMLEMAVAHAKERETFGKPLAERQAIQWMLADSAVEIQLARSLVYETLRRSEAGDDIGTSASMSKLYASEMVGRVADRAVQVLGGMALMRGFNLERMYRDIRHYRIGEGTSEVHRMLIARDLLK